MMGTMQTQVFLVNRPVPAGRSQSPELETTALLAAFGPRLAIFSGAASLLKRLTPDDSGCILIDLDSGTVADLKKVKEGVAGARFRVVALVGSHDIRPAVEAIKLGAVDVLEKPVEAHKLVKCVLALLDEIAALPPPPPTPAGPKLSPSERLVLKKLLEGKTNQQMARELRMPLRTLELRRSTIMRAFGVHCVQDLVRRVLGLGGESPLS